MPKRHNLVQQNRLPYSSIYHNILKPSLSFATKSAPSWSHTCICVCRINSPSHEVLWSIIQQISMSHCNCTFKFSSRTRTHSHVMHFSELCFVLKLFIDMPYLSGKHALSSQIKNMMHVSFLLYPRNNEQNTLLIQVEKAIC